MARPVYKDGVNYPKVTHKIKYPTDDVLCEFPALKEALGEKAEVEKGLFGEKGEQGACGDLGWNDYSAKS